MFVGEKHLYPINKTSAKLPPMSKKQQVHISVFQHDKRGKARAWKGHTTVTSPF